MCLKSFQSRKLKTPLSQLEHVQEERSPGHCWHLRHLPMGLQSPGSGWAAPKRTLRNQPEAWRIVSVLPLVIKMLSWLIFLALVKEHESWYKCWGYRYFSYKSGYWVSCKEAENLGNSLEEVFQVTNDTHRSEGAGNLYLEMDLPVCSWVCIWVSLFMGVCVCVYYVCLCTYLVVVCVCALHL